MASTTKAATSSVSGTDAFGSAITKIFQDPGVQSGIGGAVGSIINAGLGAVGIDTGLTPDQQAAAAAAEAARKKAQQTTMLIAGGAGVLVIGVVVVILVRRK